MKELSIGAAAKATSVKVPTIRYYEEIGLLPEAPRTESNRRLYTANDLERLNFIRHARELGFEIEAIRALLDLQGSPEMSCSKVDAIARTHLSNVERRIESLQALKRELTRMIRRCGQGRVADCRIIKVLQDHAQCEHHASSKHG